MVNANAGNERLWTVADLARYLGVPVGTVYKWRSTGEGPTGFRIGRYVRYKEQDVAAWLATRRDET